MYPWRLWRDLVVPGCNGPFEALSSYPVKFAVGIVIPSDGGVEKVLHASSQCSPDVFSRLANNSAQYF